MGPLGGSSPLSGPSLIQEHGAFSPFPRGHPSQPSLLGTPARTPTSPRGAASGWLRLSDLSSWWGVGACALLIPLTRWPPAKPPPVGTQASVSCSLGQSGSCWQAGPRWQATRKGRHPSSPASCAVASPSWWLLAGFMWPVSQSRDEEKAQNVWQQERGRGPEQHTWCPRPSSAAPPWGRAERGAGRGAESWGRVSPRAHLSPPEDAPEPAGLTNIPPW